MLEIGQVPEAEVKSGVVAPDVGEASEKVKEIFGVEKVEPKIPETNPVSFGKKNSEYLVSTLAKDPFEIEATSAKSRLEAGEAGQMFKGKAFIMLIVVVIGLHALFAYFIQTSSKKPQFASSAMRSISIEQHKSNDTLLGVLSATGAPAEIDIRQQLKEVTENRLGALSPQAGENAEASPKPPAEESNNNENKEELQDTDILSILNKTE